MTQRRTQQPREPLGRMFDRVPPHNLEAEMCLLGSIILGPKMLGDVQLVIAGEQDFYSEKHAAIYRAIEQGGAADLVLLTDRLRDAGMLDIVGGTEYLVRLAESVPTCVNAPHYARIVADKAALRRLAEAAGEALHAVYHSGEAGHEAVRATLDTAHSAVARVMMGLSGDRPTSFLELADEMIKAVEANEGKGPRGVRTGFHDLDAITGGLQKGELVVVAARPSMGKTAFMLNIAEQMCTGGTPYGMGASPAGTGVVLFSLEMSRESITERLVCSRSRVSSMAIRSGRALVKEEWKRLMTAVGELRAIPLYVDTLPDRTVASLRARARMMVAKFNCKVVMVDYLQLLQVPGAESRQNEVAAACRGLKALAQELEVPVLALAQLNRQNEGRADMRPRMSDIRDSGSIEQDADTIMFLHREAYYRMTDKAWMEKNADKVNIAELIVGKQRNGATGVVKLVWDADCTRFRTAEIRQDSESVSAANTIFEVPV